MYKGSGIGLAICRKIMDIHGGFIIAESTPGDGAHFHCYFPVP
jgi:signal transduction histidine kinase